MRGPRRVAVSSPRVTRSFAFEFRGAQLMYTRGTGVMKHGETILVLVKALETVSSSYGYFDTRVG